jgi:hypothetical protein
LGPRLTSLLKDAEGPGSRATRDLDPRDVRHLEALELIPFAEALFAETDGIVPIGKAHFAALWPEAMRIYADV